jgi:Polyketide cyclase / dehydrase and lipid transport
MRSDTQSIIIDVPLAAVHAFVADPANLPRWAVGFACGVRQENGRWIVQTGAGEMPVGVDADETCGVVDFRMEPAPGVSVRAFSRVMPAGEGSVYVFTQLQAPGMPDAVFDAQVQALGHDLVALKAVMEVSCPIGEPQVR